jgi:hypothetical protein
MTMTSCARNLLAAFAVLTIAPSARAESAPRQAPIEATAVDARLRARTLADEAANAYAVGDYERAHVLLGTAYGLVPAPTILLLDARALVQLNRWLEAQRTYERTVNFELPSDAAPAFRRAAEEARAELASLQARMPSLRVKLPAESRSSPVRVLIDEKPVRTELLAQPILLDPGRHSVRAEMQGHPPAAQDVSLREGEHRTLALEFGSAAPARPAQGNLGRTLSFVSFGLGGVGLATGVVGGVIAQNAHSQAEAECPDRQCEAGSAGASAVERFRGWRTISTVGYAVGVAGVSTGLVLLLVSSKGRQVGITPTWNGIRIAGAL